MARTKEIDAKHKRQRSREEDRRVQATCRPKKTTKPPLSMSPTFAMLDPRDLTIAARSPSGHYVFSYKLFRDLHDRCPKLHCCTNLEEAEQAARRFLNHRVLGLDTEFKTLGGTRITDHICLIQLASESDIALFHIALYEGDLPEHFMPPTLRKILRTQDVYKTGSMVKGDAAKIKRYLDCEVRGLIDLKQFMQTVHPKEKGQSATLAIMVERYYGLHLNKSDSTRCSDWSRPLRGSQKEYAATDAYASLMVFQAIDAERQTKGLPSAHGLVALNSASPGKRLQKSMSSSEMLFQSLRDLRNKLVSETGFSNQYIMKNATMQIIVKLLPTSATELATIRDLPEFTVQRHGPRILKVVREHVEKFRIAKQRKTKQSTLKEWISSSEVSSGPEATTDNRRVSCGRRMRIAEAALSARISKAMRKTNT